MKSGRSINELASELQRIHETKMDYVGPKGLLNFQRNGMLEVGDNGEFGLTPYAERQLGDHLNIPPKYYDKMKSSSPELLQHNVNHWLQESPEDKRLVRTLDGEARAFLSDRYRPLDNWDLTEAILPVVTEVKSKVVSCEITATKLYFKSVMEDRTAMVGRDVLQPGLTISNSEIGAGALAVRPAIHFVGCTNLAMFSEASMKKYHVGAQLESTDGAISEYLSDKTKQLTDAAVWAQVKDLVHASMDGQVFDDLVDKMRAAKGVPIESNFVKVAENVGRTYHLSPKESGGLVNFLATGGDLTKYGMSNAVTRMSQEEYTSYDRATELEQLGGTIIDLAPSQWEVLNKV